MTASAVCAATLRFLSITGSTGKERDSESGNDYFGARYYSSSIGPLHVARLERERRAGALCKARRSADA